MLSRGWRVFWVFVVVLFILGFLLLLGLVGVLVWSKFVWVLLPLLVLLVVGLVWALYVPKEVVEDGVYVKKFSVEEGRGVVKDFLCRHDAPVNLYFGGREYCEFPFYWVRDLVYVYRNIRCVKGGVVSFLSVCVRADDPGVLSFGWDLSDAELRVKAKGITRDPQFEDSEVVVRENRFTGEREEVVTRKPRTVGSKADEPLSQERGKVVNDGG